MSETRQRFLSQLDAAAERAQFVAFFARHGIDGLDGATRGSLERAGVALLDQIAARKVVLSP